MFLLAAVHFPSRAFYSDKEISQKARELVSDVEEAETLVGHMNTIIVGDFNANPFDGALCEADCIHAVSSKEIAKQGARRVLNKKYQMFYNPMWNLFGDFHSPCGTYYYREAKLGMYFWNIYDQVVIRPRLSDSFVKDALKILTGNHNVSFVDCSGVPKEEISDHLPIFFEIREEFFL